MKQIITIFLFLLILNLSAEAVTVDNLSEVTTKLESIERLIGYMFFWFKLFGIALCSISGYLTYFIFRFSFKKGVL